eukprot:TRINITY_DN60473_c0_g1_i1.p1 TRINITY_DN60473_c0_g1~~TRINITY_DN60473_c0_g1_i1.p1  ORF type:complete len:622 (-),score=205.52 TRINITY_DN60473_c0_g1_i1:3-1868(-)
MEVDQVQPKRAHSVPVPRLYKVAANILKNFEDGKDSLKNLVFNCKKHPNKKGLFSLVMETENHKKQLDQATQKIELFVTEPRFNKHLAYVLINELFWGKQTLPGESLPVQTVLKYKKRLKKSIDMEGGIDGRALCDNWPRYARINTLCINKHRLNTQLKEEGWVEVMYDKSEVDNVQFLQLISNLKENQYLSDLHIPNLLVFPPKSQLYNHGLVKDGSLMLQDKSSCFPVAALAPPAGSSVLDACAAPGMKTSQLAAAVCGDKFSVLGGDPPAGAKVVAVERSVKRYGLLKEILERSQATLVTEVLNQDFLKIDPSMHLDVEYITVDPSCSGTGMARRGGGDEEPSEERLESLASVQTTLLLHALSFPSAKRVVYSTCAVSVVENEQVVAKVLEKAAGWEVVSIMPTWERRGLGEFSDGQKFVRALASEDMCNGFFVAVLERKGCIKAKKRKKVSEDNEELSEEILGENSDDVINDQPVEKAKKRKKSKDNKHELADATHDVPDSNEVEVEIKKKKKKKSKDKLSENDDAIHVPESNEKEEVETKKKKKKSKDKSLDTEENISLHSEEVSALSESKHKKKKKEKKSKDFEEEIEETSEVNDDSEQPRKKKKKKDKVKCNED